MPYELVQQYWLAWVVMLSPRSLTTTSESGNSRRAAMDNGESARPMERACTMSALPDMRGDRWLTLDLTPSISFAKTEEEPKDKKWHVAATMDEVQPSLG